MNRNSPPRFFQAVRLTEQSSQEENVNLITAGFYETLAHLSELLGDVAKGKENPLLDLRLTSAGHRRIVL